MKSIVKNTMLAAVMVAGLSLTSCKGKNDDGDNGSTDATSVTDTTNTVTSAPIADTVVKKDGDTVIETGTKNDTKENATGTQVP